MPPPPSSKLLPVHAVLEALLTAHKEGRVQELLAQRPRTTRAPPARWLGAGWGRSGTLVARPGHPSKPTPRR